MGKQTRQNLSIKCTASSSRSKRDLTRRPPTCRRARRFFFSARCQRVVPHGKALVTRAVQRRALRCPGPLCDGQPYTFRCPYVHICHVTWLSYSLCSKFSSLGEKLRKKKRVINKVGQREFRLLKEVFFFKLLCVGILQY